MAASNLQTLVDSYIYIVQNRRTDEYYISFTRDPEKRLKELEKVYDKAKLMLHPYQGTYKATDPHDAIARGTLIRRDVHEFISKHANCRRLKGLKGFWFELRGNALQDVQYEIEQICTKHSAPKAREKDDEVEELMHNIAGL